MSDATQYPPNASPVPWRVPNDNARQSSNSVTNSISEMETDSNSRADWRRSRTKWRSNIAQTRDSEDESRKQEEEQEEYLNPRRASGRNYRRWPRFPMPSQALLRAVCLNMHIGLVLLHVILLAIHFPHWERRKIIPLGSQSVGWSIGLPAVSQAFIILYTAGILVLTQQLSLRRNFLTQQALTATHDKSMAWNGLGSSLLSLWRQVSITSSVWGVACITLYLSGISTLHISTPTLLTLQTFNNTIAKNLNTTRALPNPDVDTSDSLLPVYNYFVQAAPILSLLGQYSQLSTIGLEGSTVYDILPANQGEGHVGVNTTTFEVSCDGLPNPRISGNGSIWNVTSDLLTGAAYDDQQKSDFSVSPIVPNVVRMALSTPDGEEIASSDNRILYYSTVNFTDSNSETGSRITLEPPMSLGDTQVYSLQVMACRFSSRNKTMPVDAHTRRLVEPPLPKTSSIWGNPQPSPSFMNSTELSTIQAWQSVLSEVSTVRSSCDVSCNSGPRTALDQFLIRQLGILPDIDPVNDPQPHPQLELFQLENALANLTAALQWSTTQLEPGGSSGSPLLNMAFSGQTTILQPQLASRLNLNVVPISVGLAASLVLLVLAVMLVGKPEMKTTVVGSAGVLELIWLLRDRSDLLRRISTVRTPSAEELRAAGMFLVRMAGESDDVTDHETSYHLFSGMENDY